MLVFATATAVVLVVSAVLGGGVLLAVDVYLHKRMEKYAGVNVWGYRGPVVPRKKPGELRAVMLGGSTAFGYGTPWDQAIPAYLEQKLRSRLDGRPATVVNLAYNNEGSYSFLFTLKDYEYLEYDVALLYEGYNDLGGYNVSVFRHQSPVFRLTGYLPIFPVVFSEKAMALRAGGDLTAAYRQQRGEIKTVFRPNLTSRATATALKVTADISKSLEQQLERFAKAHAQIPPYQPSVGPADCPHPWTRYCQGVYKAVDSAVAQGKRVIVITQPYMRDDVGGPLHHQQQDALRTMLEKRYSGNPKVRYVDLGDAVDLKDAALCYDGVHLTPRGNEIVAERLVDPLLDLAGMRRAARVAPSR